MQILVVDRAALRPLRLGLELISGVKRLHPGFELGPVGRLLHHAESLRRLQAGETPEQIEESWREGIEAFRQRRKAYLLYP